VCSNVDFSVFSYCLWFSDVPVGSVRIRFVGIRKVFERKTRKEHEMSSRRRYVRETVYVAPGRKTVVSDPIDASVVIFRVFRPCTAVNVSIVRCVRTGDTTRALAACTRSSVLGTQSVRESPSCPATIRDFIWKHCL